MGDGVLDVTYCVDDRAIPIRQSEGTTLSIRAPSYFESIEEMIRRIVLEVLTEKGIITSEDESRLDLSTIGELYES